MLKAVFLHHPAICVVVLQLIALNHRRCRITCFAFQAHQRPCPIYSLRRTCSNEGASFARGKVELLEGSSLGKETESLLEDEPLVQSNWTCPFQTTNPLALAQSSLDGRLLCAAECAYRIDEDKPYYRSISFLPGSVVKRITHGVNSVIIGYTFDGVIISFRGTVSSSPLDWLQNAALYLKEPGDGIEGKVHAGFLSAVRALWPSLKETLKEMIQIAEPQIFLTGHSKGGALAALAAIMMQRDNELPDPSYVCSFAAPKLGNAYFAAAYDREVEHTSYEGYLDLIPLLPPSNRMMESMGEEMADMVNE
mmetsp:Transcript_18539/g.53446  ORF Transcript_18539/g.53446 Transcript_18539/m.53446 type:complete len:308 (+) Transcript_18539:147-1070(+)